MSAAATRESERWTVVLEVLDESVPVSAFLGFVAAWSAGRRGVGVVAGVDGVGWDGWKSRHFVFCIYK